MKKEWTDPILEKIDIEETAAEGSLGDDGVDLVS